jgi:hypothetical protein
MALGEGRFRYKRPPEPKLQLTSMMDMFTIIMIFLLVSFSTKPDTFQLDRNIELPKSTAKMDYTKSVQLVLSKDKLQLDGEMLGEVEGESIAGLNPADLKRSPTKPRPRKGSRRALGTCSSSATAPIRSRPSIK